MEKLGFSFQEHYALPTEQVIDLLAETGFCAVSPQWQPGGNWEDVIRLARQRDLTIQSLHGPIRGMPAAWSRDPDVFAPILQQLLQSATACARYGIPLLVIHPWNGVNYTFREEMLHFDHFDALVALAEREQIMIAFENLEGQEFLAALMARYAGSPAVGFCWDSGHERCYTPGQDFLSRYGSRLVMTHLNDNLGVTDPSGRLQGTDDLHLLPYHGTLDWEDTIRRLKEVRKQEILNFELKIRPKGDRCKLDLYSKLTLREYLSEAYQRARSATSGYFL